jgi:predicted AAA+ superfamily ATPase
MIKRKAETVLRELASQFKAVALTGPRQSGKTTLAKMVFPKKPYVSLENPDERNLALNDPRQFLSRFQTGAILDEVQRAPELFSYLQQIIDESKSKGQFILTGSNNFALLENISQTLAGRVGYLELLPFSLSETEKSGKALELDELIFSGSYPAVIYEKANPRLWFPSYIRTYVERDVRQIKNISSLALFQRLLYLCAGRVGQQLNLSSLANDVGLDYKTIQSWLGVLQNSYIIFLLPPYHNNFNKRIIKSPKLYFYDTGLASYLLGITNAKQLFNHSLKGALFENFVLAEMLKNRYNKGERSNLYYFRDSTGNEVDIVIDEGNKLTPVELKAGETISGDYFKNLHYWEALTGKKGGLVIYTGKEANIRQYNFAVENWIKVKNL